MKLLQHRYEFLTHIVASVRVHSISEQCSPKLLHLRPCLALGSFEQLYSDLFGDRSGLCKVAMLQN